MQPDDINLDANLDSLEDDTPMGLSEGIDKYLAGEIPVEPTQTPVVAQAKPKEAAPTNNAKEDEEEEEDEFPEIGKIKDPELKPEEKKEDPEAFDEAEFDKQTAEEIKGMDVKAGDKWKALKAQVKELKLQAAQAKPASAVVPDDIKQELEQLRIKAAEAEELRERNHQLLQVNDEVAVKQSDAYIQGVTAPIKEMEAIIAQIAEYAKVDGKDIADAIAETDITKQDEMLEDLELKLGRRVASRVERLADDFKAIKAKERDLTTNAATTIAEGRKMKEREEARKLEENKNRFQLSTEESFKAYASKVPGLTDSSGNLTDTAKAIMNKTKSLDPVSLSPIDIGFMAFCANAFPEARRAIVALQKENNLLKAAQGKGGALPSTTSTRKPSTPSGEYEEPLGLAAHMAEQDLIFTGR